MCLWLLTTCLGLIPVNPVPTAIIVVPAPILQPTPAPTIILPPPPGNIMPPVSLPPPPPPPPPPTTPPPPPPPPPPTTPPPPPPTPPPPPPTTNTPPPPASTNITLIQTGILLPVIICQNPSIVCVANPNQPTPGPVAPSIDPRLGTPPPAPGSSASLQLPPLTSYSGHIPSYDTAVMFPRQRRSIRINEKMYKVQNQLYENKHVIKKRQSCVCVPAGTCPPGGSGNLGNGLIDLRIVTPNNPCGAGTQYCCVGAQPIIGCGTLQPTPATVVASAGQASFGEFPWMALILSKQNDYIAGGVLIDQVNVLTVIHRLQTYIVGNTVPNVKVRLGDWDVAFTYEPVPFQEYTVAKVFTHPSFNSATLQYDVAVLRLASTVPITPQAGAAPTINRACLPASTTAAYTGQRCWVTGWGKNAFGVNGNYQQILKKVEVPVVAPDACQTALRNARLGPNYVLDTTSFICAGGEVEKDSCTGDGGSGLMCEVNGQWTVVGLVAWGLGCAASGVPGVYVNLATLLPWIQQQVAAS